MLSELWVSNLAVAERLKARFAPGLNVLTGETGAGKSLVVGALDLVLGGRASASLVRKGTAEAEIVARFELAPDHFASRGLDQPLDDGTLVLRRVVGADGRSRAYVNERPVPVAWLRKLGAVLADLHGQHEQQNLLREETHLDYLDAYAGAAELADEVRGRYRRYVEARGRLGEFRARLRKSAEEREFLLYQFRELEAAGLREGEEEELLRERHLAAHAGRLAEEAGHALADLVEGEPHAEELLGKASRHLERAVELDAELEPIRRQVDEALVAVEEAGRELSGYLDSLQTDPARLEEIEARLGLVADLRRKYSEDMDGLIRHRDRLREMIEAADEAPQRSAELEAAERVAGEELGAACSRLSAKRSRAAAGLGREVSRELRELGMKHAGFQVELRPLRQGEALVGRATPVGARGAEEVSFRITPNPGEAAGPLSRIASGGEVSRVMLALKNVLRRVDPVPVIIFDEVDAGIGGVVAEAVARRLVSIASNRQVLVITHLAVVAGWAGHHLRLVKTTARGRTRIEAEELRGREREEELARMLAGTTGGENARRTARVLLAQGKERNEDATGDAAVP